MYVSVLLMLVGGAIGFASRGHWIYAAAVAIGIHLRVVCFEKPRLARTHFGGEGMHGLIGKMITTPGQRDLFIAILLAGVGDMPGCLSYVVAKDPTDGNALWITEVWDSKESHQASLSLPAVQDAIARGRAMIAGFGDRTETVPVGGHGLTAVKR